MAELPLPLPLPRHWRLCPNYRTWNLIEDKFSPFAKDTLAKLVKFVKDECIPAEATFHAQVSTDPATRWKTYPSIIEDLKKKARSLGLWNLFLSKAVCLLATLKKTCPPLMSAAALPGRRSAVDQSRIRRHGRNHGSRAFQTHRYNAFVLTIAKAPRVAPEACNCSAPDTGNMEVLARYGNQAQKDKWLKPLLEGKTRSSFAMTERFIASSELVLFRY